MEPSFKQTVEDIVARHHAFLRKELPRITVLIDDLIASQPNSEPLSEAQQLYKKVRTKIETHLKDEETVLFPTGIAIESSEQIPDSALDLRARLEEMEKEHDGCGKALATISDMVSKNHAGDSKKELLTVLQMVQDDLCVHVEKENTQVHPKFLDLLKSAGI